LPEPGICGTLSGGGRQVAKITKYIGYYLDAPPKAQGGVMYPQNQVSKHVLHAIYDQPFRNIHSTGATQDPFFDDLYPSTTPSQASV
jgi:hypothetical protein